jgi:DNA invertase Pin-like site-specific DNA recombinase
VRVSTADQVHDSQRAEVETAAAARGDRIGRWYVDTATARTIRRPALDELRRDVARRRWDRIYTYRLDRMARLRLVDAFALLAEFERGGARVVAVADRFDFADPVVGDLLLALALWVARREAETTSERVRAGMDAARRRGKHVGRPRRYVDIARAQRLLAEGRSKAAVARVLAIGEATLRRALAAGPPEGSPLAAAGKPRDDTGPAGADQPRGKE